MAGLRLNEKRYIDAAGLFAVFMAGLAVHFVLMFTFFNFDRALGIYDDELRYYSIARSLYYGTGLRIRDIPVSFQKIGLSLLMMPFFAVKDVVLRLKLMAGTNIVIMNLSVIFVWLICSELKLSRKAKYFASFLTAVWPDMIYSFTFMSEPMYWPMSAAFFWLWLVNERRQSFLIAAVAGLLCYFMYLTKEVALAFMIALVAFEVVYPFVSFAFQEVIKTNNGIERKALREFFRPKHFALAVVLIVVFALCHVAMKMTLFRGLGGSYNNQMGIQAIMFVYNFMYLIYAFLYYIAAVLAASLVIPAVYPVANFKHMNEESRKFFCCITLFALVITATIAYTISVRENLGDITPAIHLRYYGSFFVLLIVCFLSSMQNAGTETIARTRGLSAGILALALMYVCMMFKGIRFLSAADQYILLWYSAIGADISSSVYPPMLFPPSGRTLVLFPSSIIANVVIVLVAFLFHHVYTRRGRRVALSVYAFIILVATAGLNFYAAQNTKESYIAHSEHTAGEMVRIAGYLKDKEDANILYLNYGLTYRRYDYRSRYVDTYIDHKRLYIINNDEIAGKMSGSSLDVSKITLKGENPAGYYEDIEGIDYILLERVNSAEQKRLVDVELVLQGEHFLLYKNMNRNVLKFAD